MTILPKNRRKYKAARTALQDSHPSVSSRLPKEPFFSPGISMAACSPRASPSSCPPGGGRHTRLADLVTSRLRRNLHLPKDPRPRAGRRTPPTSAWRWSAARTPAQPPDRGAPGPPGTRTSREVTGSGSNTSDPTFERDPSPGSRRGRLVLNLLAGRGGRPGRLPYKSIKEVQAA